jgi:hypothetical protein
MKSSQNLLLSIAVFCWMTAAPSFASVRSSYAQDAQQTSPDTQQPNPPNNKQASKKNPPPNTNQPASGQPGSATGSQPDTAPKPLFGGQINLKSSRQSKDTATLGFNGLDPNGQVQKAFLNAAPTAADVAKAQQLTKTGVTKDELAFFVQEGGLNTPGGQQ